MDVHSSSACISFGVPVASSSSMSAVDTVTRLGGTVAGSYVRMVLCDALSV